MKKILLLLSLALFVMVSTMAVDSYTTAIVDSEAKVTITNPNSPIIVRAIEGLEIRQGESKHALTITNNMNVTVEITGLEIDHNDLSFSFISSSIPSKESLSVDLKVDDYCRAGHLSSVPVIFTADFLDGSKNIVGNARIATTINLEVLEGELDLEITEEKLVALWNDDSAPDDTKYYYRYRKTEEHSWGDWIEIKSDTKFYKSIPGQYEFKACLGDKVVSQVQFIEIEKPSKEDKKKEEYEKYLEEHFNYQVEGLPESEDDNN